jgi:DNA-binding NarL/FixJ family response regulator
MSVKQFAGVGKRESMFEMKKPPRIERNLNRNTAMILSVSPGGQDCQALEHIFAHASDWAAYTNCNWKLMARSTLTSAFAELRRHRIPIVLCERELEPGSWLDMLEGLLSLPEPPFLIVTSRLADERFWAEALNRGAYDVLAKPFDLKEVVRVLSLAWLHWKVRNEVPAQVPQAWKAASGM